MVANSAIGSIPWYRQGWPWLLIALPAAAVVASFITLYLAIVSGDSMVVDDYYKEGRAINQRIARDQVAAGLDLRATVAGVDGVATRLDLAAAIDQTFAMPDRLTLRWVHVTDAARDQVITLDRVRHGEFRGPAFWPLDGRWRVHVDEPGGQWRLVSELWTAGGDRSMTILPRSTLAQPAVRDEAKGGVR